MRKINKLEMALGYRNMGAINLEIAKEFFPLESKGVSIYEMVEKKTEGTAK
jgi:hypothetical protein